MITKIIYDYFKDKDVVKEPSDRVTFSPSYFTSCLRQVYYKKTCETPSEPLTEATYLKFEMGHAVHDKLQDILKDIGIYKEGEDFKEIHYEGFDFIYRVDGILNINEIDYMLEIKSIYNTGFYAIEKAAKPEHELQLLLYMIFEKVDRGLLLYIGRDSGRMVEYNYQVDSLYEKYKQFIDTRLASFHSLKKEIETRDIPDREYEIVIKNYNGDLNFEFTKDKEKYKSAWQCSYCSYKTKCWADVISQMSENTFYMNGQFIK